MDYHKDSGGSLTEFRTILSHLTDIKPAKHADVSNTDFAATYALMEELRQDLLKYKKTGSITCKNCGRVKNSHLYQNPWGCPGWEQK